MLDSKEYFPVLANNPELAYFDNASSTPTHRLVIEAMNEYYEHYRANVGRGSYTIADRAAEAVELARDKIANLLNADKDNLLFTTGATQGLNWVAEWNKNAPVVVLFDSNHNANIVPWLAQGRTEENDRLKVVSGYNEFKKIIPELPPNSIVSFSSVNNVNGHETELWDVITELAHLCGAKVCVDYTQSITTSKINLTPSIRNPDYLVFSGHKMYGPTGIGVLYVKEDLDKLRSMTYGGGAVVDVGFDHVDFARGWDKHQAGTPSIANIIGLGVAAEIIHFYGQSEIFKTQTDIVRRIFPPSRFIDELYTCRPDGLFDIGKGANFLALRSKHYYANDIGDLMPRDVAIRTGRLCAHPYVDKLSNGMGVLRITPGPYNTQEDIDKLVDGLTNALDTLRKTCPRL